MILLLQTTARAPFTAAEWGELIGSVEKLVVAVIAAIGGLIILIMQNRHQQKQNRTIIDQNVSHESRAQARAVGNADQVATLPPFPGSQEERKSDDA